MRKIVAVIFLLTIVTPTTPVLAQAAFAEKVGTKLLVSLIGAIAGKGFNSIFGEGPQPVTKKQLDDALRNSFKSAKLNDIQADVIDLKTKVRSYQSTGSTASRREQIDGITDIADHIRSNIQVQIHHGAFFDLLPDYMTATSIWLTFKAERKYVAVDDNVTASQKVVAEKEANEIVAAEAVHALSMVRDFYYNDFIDTSERRCFRKQANALLYNQKGHDIPNQIGILKSQPKKDFSKKFCMADVMKYLVRQAPSVGGIASFGFTPHQDFYRGYRTFKHPRKNEWFYTYETSIGRKRGGEYTLDGPYPTKAKADSARVAKAIVFYGDLLGNIPGIVRNWENLAVKISEHIHEGHYKTEAKRLSRELGAR